MKFLILTSIVALLASLSAMAESPLKLELLAPNEPISLKKDDLEKPGVGTVLPPKVDITLRYRITNTGKEAVVIKHGGDESFNRLTIKGPGASDVPYRGPMTLNYAYGNPVTFKPGESKEFEIKGLKYGSRDMSYWSISKAGDYEASMSFVSRVGREKLTLKSKAIKFSVAVK